MILLEKLHQTYLHRVMKNNFQAYELIGRFDDRYQDLLHPLEKMVFVTFSEQQGKVYYTTDRIIWEHDPNQTEFDHQRVVISLRDNILKKEGWQPLPSKEVKISDIQFITSLLVQKPGVLIKQPGHILPLLIGTRAHQYGQILMPSGPPIFELWNILNDYQDKRIHVKNHAIIKFICSYLRTYTTSIIYIDLSFEEQMEIYAQTFKATSFGNAGKIICYWEIAYHYLILTLSHVVIVEKASKVHQQMTHEQFLATIQEFIILDGFPLVREEIEDLIQLTVEFRGDEVRMLTYELDE